MATHFPIVFEREDSGVFSAYVAGLPVLVLSFALLAGISNLFSYKPAPQNVVQMYLKDDAGPYLMVFTFFVAALGPAMEEIFFRGFGYASLRRTMGPVRAALFTSRSSC